MRAEAAAPAGPWDDLAALEVLVRTHLAAHERQASRSTARRASVAVTVLTCDDAPHVLVLKRALGGRNAGQWALPGGRADPGETQVETALRELEEETGVAAGPEHVAGLLDDFVTASGFVVTPVVVVVPGAVEPVPDPREVQSLHPLAVRRLVAPDVPHWEPAPPGPDVLSLQLADDWVVHAPTGAFLHQFREVALLGRATRVADVVQPDFTHR